MKKVDAKPPLFVGGPKLEPFDALEPWLLAEKNEVQLPITILVSTSKLAINGGTIGSKKVALEDSALGVSLLDRVRQHCPKAERCPLWLQGRLRERGRFSVTRVTPLPHAEVLFARVAIDPESNADVVRAIEQLEDEDKDRPRKVIVDAGVASIPILIAARHDGRTYERRDITNRMNLPINAPPQPATMVDITVGSVCEDLLYKLITPPPSASVGGNFKVYSEQVLSVRDWIAFWDARRAKSLADIHAELQPLVDAYWKQHGTTQIVP